MIASILTIGDEILIGQIIDTNSAWMAQQLNLQGIQIKEILSISDEREHILEGVTRCLGHSDLVLVTGGLGPTNDDITKKTLADFFDSELYFHEPTYARILKLFEKLRRQPTEAHREQAYMPEKANILFNKMGTAPGMWFERDEKVLVSMPGVPYEMKYLMEHQVLPKLKSSFPLSPIAHRTILTVGDGESRIAKRIESLEQSLPAHIKLAYLPGLGQVRLRLTARGKEENILQPELDEYVQQIRDTIPELVFGYGTDRLEAVVGNMLRERSLTLVTAESCTGGLLAHRITSVPGASDYFLGSVVAYANDIKETQLGVQATTLADQGAVSEACVLEMADGVRERMRADLAISISGIAGPGGGTPEKPVGTIWMAIASENRRESHLLQLGKDRQRNIEYTATQALNMIRKFLLAQ